MLHCVLLGSLVAGVSQVLACERGFLAGDSRLPRRGKCPGVQPRVDHLLLTPVVPCLFQKAANLLRT